MRPRCRGLAGVMRAAKALTVRQVVLGAAVADFLDVVGEHSVRWLRLGAPQAVLDHHSGPQLERSPCHATPDIAA